MEGAKNTYRVTDVADRLAELRLELAAQKAGNSSQKAFKPQSILPLPETIGLTDSVALPQANQQVATEVLGVHDFSTPVALPRPFKLMYGDSDYTNILLHAKLDNSTNDSSSAGSNLTVNGTSKFVAGMIRQGFKFDGATYLTAADATKLNPATGDFSYGCWIYRTAISGDSQDAIIGKRAQTSTSVGWKLQIVNVGGNANKINAILCDGSASNITVTSNNQISLSKWYFIFVTVSRAGNMTLYVYDVAAGTLDTNSVSVASQPATLQDATRIFTVGRRNNTAANDWFTGIIDDIWFFTRALNSSEVSGLFNNGLMGVSNLAYPPFRTNFATT